MCMALLLQSQHLVRWSYFCLYLSCMAGSYEIITFLSVPWSCVRQASRLPNHQWAWAAKCRHITHFITHTKFAQAATFMHIQAAAPHLTHTQTFTSLLFVLRACAADAKWTAERSGAGRQPPGCVSVCVCLRWCDISGLTWSGTLPPRAWRELPGKDGDGGLGSPGENFMVWTKKILKLEINCKTSWSLLTICFVIFWM